MYGLEL